MTKFEHIAEADFTFGQSRGSLLSHDIDRASGPSPESTRLSSNNLPTNERYDHCMLTSVAELKSHYVDDSGQGVLPEHLGLRSGLTRIQNAILLWLIRLRCSTLIARAQKQEEAINPKALTQEWNTFARSSLRFLYGGELFRKIDSGMGRITHLTGEQEQLLQSIRGYQSDFAEDVRVLAESFGKEYFGPSVQQRALANVISMRLFAALEHGEPPSRAAMNAIALLHPVTDDVIDRGEFRSGTLAKITELLAGGDPMPSDKFEELVFKLIADIYDAFPRESHPQLDWCLRRLHAEQLRSSKQNRALDLDQLLDISFIKGGLSTIAAGYIALGALTPQQTDFFFKGGAIFQLMDDLGDIDEDRRDDIRTVWTQALGRQRELREVMHRFLALEGAFEQELQGLCTDFKEPAWVQRIYSLGFVATILRAVLNHPAKLRRSVAQALNPFLPVPFWVVQRNAAGLAEALKQREGSADDRLHKLASSFLGGEA